MRSFLLTSLFITAFLANIPSAFATHPTDIEVKFQQLEVGVDRGAITVSYTIASRDWHAMRDAEIDPRLNLFTASRGHHSFDFRYSTALTRRHGVVSFPRDIKLRGSKLVELQVVGFSGYSHVARTSFGERCAERIRVRVHRGRGHGHGHGHGHHDDGRAELIEACGKASRHNMSDCVERASKLDRRFAVQTVEACAEHTGFDSQLRQCIDRARKFARFNPAPSIRACGESTKFVSRMNHCIDRAAEYTREPSRVIAACDAATEFSSDFDRCIDNSTELGRRAAAVIKACDQHSKWRSDFHRCVELSAKSRRT